MSRYSRQELFSGIGRPGQARLRAATAAVVGVGALGSVLAELLARAGVGRLILIDRDFVEESNLQRQSLFTEADAARGLPKARAAEAHLRAINSEVALVAQVADLSADNAEGLLAGADVVLDGSDNFEARFLVNDFCLRAGVPWIYGACVGSYGLALAVRPGVTPCLRCLLEEMPAPGSSPTCDTAGVVAPIVHVVAGVQAGEALKLLAGRAEDLLPGMLTADLWAGVFDVMDLAQRRPSCPACTLGRFEAADAAPRSAVLCGRDAIQIRPARDAAIDLAELAGRLAAVGSVVKNDYLVRFTARDADLAVFADGRAIVKGVKDAAQARGVYAKYVGA